MAPQYAKHGWITLETATLEKYASALRDMHRLEEYIRVLLLLLARRAASCQQMAREPLLVDDDDNHDDDNNVDGNDGGHAIFGEAGSATLLLREIVAWSEKLPGAATGASSSSLQVPFGKYFGDVSVSKVAHHSPDSDGFRLKLKFRYVLHGAGAGSGGGIKDNGSVVFDKVRLHTRRSRAFGFEREVWLESLEEVVLEDGEIVVWVDGNVSSLSYFWL